MANIGTWFKNVFKRKPEGPAPATEAAPTTLRVTVPAPAAPSVVEKPSEMNFEDILSTIQQIEEIVGPSDGGEDTAQLDALQMPFPEMVKLSPNSFDVAPDETEGKSFEVLVQDLYVQLAKGKVETSLKHFLAGVPPRYLAIGKNAVKDEALSLPLPLVVRLVDPHQLQSRMAPRKSAMPGADLPDLFAAAPKGGVPAAAEPAVQPKVEAPVRPSIMLPMGVMARIMPASFRLPSGMKAFPAIKIKVEIDDLFRKLASGKVDVRRLDFLINVPSQFLAPPTEGASEDLVLLPLPDVVAAIPPEDWQKQLGPSEAPASVAHLPDLFMSSAPPPPPPPVVPAEVEEAVEVAEEEPVVAAEEPGIPAGEAPAVLESALQEEAAAVEPEPEAPMEAPAPAAPEAVSLPDPVEAPAPAETPAAAPAPVPEPVVAPPVEEPMAAPAAPIAPAANEPPAAPAPAVAPEEDIEKLVQRVLGEKKVRKLDFSEIAARFKESKGFEGCAIIHKEGDLLAASWGHKATDMLEVISPQIWKRVSGYVEHLDEGEMKSVTISVSTHLLTFVQEGDICFVAVHQADDFNLTRLSFVQRVAGELGRRYGAKKS